MDNERLNRDQIIATYKKLLEATTLKPNELWLSSGGALVIHGLRQDAGDIDSGCHQDAFDTASSALGITSTPFRANHAYIPEGTPNLIIPQFRADILLEPDTTTDDITVIDGVTVYTLPFLLKQKLALNREKDQNDIAALKRALEPPAPKRTGGVSKRQYLLEALQAEAFIHKAWIIAAFSVVRSQPDSTRHPYRLIKPDDNKDQRYWFIDPSNNNTPTAIDDTDRRQPLFAFTEPFQLVPNDLPNVTSPVDTIVGSVLFNAMALVWPFGNKIAYMNGEINGGKLEKLVAGRLTDDVDDPKDELPDRIYVRELLRFCEAMSAIAGLTQLDTPAASPKSMSVDPAIAVRRDELLKEYSDQLHDPAIVARIEGELVAMDRAWFVGDPAERFYIKGSSFEVTRKRMFIMYGIETGFNDNSKGVSLITPSLKEGWDIEKLPGMAESLRAGSFNRGHQTALGGESVKYFYRIFQNTTVLEADCGATSGLQWTITKDNYRQFVGLHMVDKDGRTVPIPVTQEAPDPKILDRQITVRSPMLCRTKAPSFCARCVGDALAASPTGLHIATSDVGSTFMYAFMKKMHGTALKVARYRPKLSIS